MNGQMWAQIGDIVDSADGPQAWNPGDEVRFHGASEEQACSSVDDPRPVLTPRTIYRLEALARRGWFTDVTLVGIEGRFNAACFERA